MNSAPNHVEVLQNRDEQPVSKRADEALKAIELAVLEASFTRSPLKCARHSISRSCMLPSVMSHSKRVPLRSRRRRRTRPPPRRCVTPCALGECVTQVACHVGGPLLGPVFSLFSLFNSFDTVPLEFLGVVTVVAVSTCAYT